MKTRFKVMNGLSIKGRFNSLLVHRALLRSVSYCKSRLAFTISANLLVFVSLSLVANSSTALAESLKTSSVDLNTPTAKFINTADFAAPDAQEVTVDIPNAFHWAVFQQGVINGWRYVLYPDGSAFILPEDNARTRSFSLDCRAGLSCQITRPDMSIFHVKAVGAKRPAIPENPDGDAVAEYLANWILAGTGTPPQRPQSQSGTQAPAQTIQDIPDLSSEEMSDASPEELANANDNEPQPVCAQVDRGIPGLCSEPINTSVKSSRLPAIRVTQNSDEKRSRVSSQSLAKEKSAVTDSEPFLKRINTNCSITASTSLGIIKDGDTDRTIGKPRLSLGCSTRYTDRLSVRVSLLKYFSDQTDFDPDFTYSVNYRLSDKISLNYANYNAQFNGANGNFWDALTDGTLRGVYKLPRFKLPNEKEVYCSASMKLPNPLNDSFNLSCGYAVTEKLRIGATLNFYLPGVQGDFDPDYSYTASYRINKNFLLSYSNYSNNRWPWNRGNNPGPGLAGGSVSLTYAVKF